MKIARVHTSGFRGLPDHVFDLAHPSSGEPEDLVLITGPSSSGKTSFLDAIVAAKDDVAPYGPRRSTASHVRRGEAAAKVQVTWALSADERQSTGGQAVITSESVFGPGVLPSFAHDPALQSVLRRYDHDPSIGKIEYFHAGRTLSRGALGEGALDVSTQARHRLEKDPRKYGSVQRYLVELCLGLRDALPEGSGPARFAELFASLCRTKRFEGIERSGQDYRLIFSGAGGAIARDLDELSHSEQQAVLFAATAVQIGLCHSVVLIDSVELYLSSEDVVPFVDALRGLGVDNQLIVTTSSRELIALAPSRAVIRL